MGRWGGRDRSYLQLNALDGALDAGWNEQEHPRSEGGQFSSGGSSGAVSSGQQLKAAMKNRDKFDKLLSEYAGTHSKKELKQAYKDMTGYEYYPSSGKSGTKADIVKALENRQREDELNRDLTRAQHKYAKP